MIKQFLLSKSGERATISILNPDRLPEVLNLLEETRAALPEAQKMFLLPQPASYFEKLLAHQDGVLLGVSSKGQLVAQMAVMGPLSLVDVIDQQKLTRNEVYFHHAAEADEVVLAKSMTVHPDWRGNELSQFLLESMLDLPFVRTSDHVFAQISADNVRSWEIFLRHGFGIVAAAIDPVDHKPRFVVQKPIRGFALHPQHSADDIDAHTDFAAIMRLTQQEALVGMLDEGGEAFKLAFYASINSAAAWYDKAANTNLVG